MAKMDAHFDARVFSLPDDGSVRLRVVLVRVFSVGVWVGSKLALKFGRSRLLYAWRRHPSLDREVSVYAWKSARLGVALPQRSTHVCTHIYTS